MDSEENTWKLASNEEASKVMEFELQLWRVFYGFLRWQEECENNSNGTMLTGNELAILHIIKLHDKPKTITDIERILNRNDTHNIRYSINKLIKIGLVKKTLSSFSGKNYFFQTTEAGDKNTENYSKMRKLFLVGMFSESSLDLQDMIKNLTKIRSIYDEADRAITQNFFKSRNYKNSANRTGTSSRGSILVVEDDPITSKVTQEILSDSYYQVDAAMSGEMAINLTEKNDYDIIFTNIGLPDIHGCDLTRRIRASEQNKNNHTPIIGLTAQVNSKDKRECIEAGMNAVFIKPLVKEKVEDIFAMFIAKYDRVIEEDSQKVALESDLLELKGEVIDLKLGAELVGGNRELAKNAIAMLVDSLASDIESLEKFCHSHDLEAAQAILHKVKGGVSYCGVPRLKEACVRLDTYLKSGKMDVILNLYNLLYSEFVAVRERLASI